jgi:hypothetical protein
MNKFGGGTDGNTKGDIIASYIPLVGWVNGFSGKRANKLENQNYRDAELLNATADAYAQDEAERREAEKLANTKFGGIFGTGGLRGANRLIGEENRDANIRLAIAKDMNLQKIRSQYMTSINN